MATTVARQLTGLLILWALTSGASGSELDKAGDQHILPAWHGTWRGLLSNLPVRENARTIEVRLTISAGEHEKDGCLDWVTSYIEAGNVMQTKDYQMCRRRNGEYFLDEGGGLVLETSLFGDVMYSGFKANERFLVDRHEIDGDEMLQEIFFAEPGPEPMGIIQALMGRGLQKIEYSRVE
ncbi:MAG: hypothetical protein AAGA95_05760 [Pseudomonadota bacterium]